MRISVWPTLRMAIVIPMLAACADSTKPLTTDSLSGATDDHLNFVITAYSKGIPTSQRTLRSPVTIEREAGLAIARVSGESSALAPMPRMSAQTSTPQALSAAATLQSPSIPIAFSAAKAQGIALAQTHSFRRVSDPGALYTLRIEPLSSTPGPSRLFTVARNGVVLGTVEMRYEKSERVWHLRHAIVHALDANGQVRARGELSGSASLRTRLEQAFSLTGSLNVQSSLLSNGDAAASSGSLPKGATAFAGDYDEGEEEVDCRAFLEGLGESVIGLIVATEAGGPVGFLLMSGVVIWKVYKYAKCMEDAEAT